MENNEYEWIEFYSELADKLLPYKNDRNALIEKLQDLYSELDMKLPKLESSGIPNDIDPYTVFGLFNKGISLTNRVKLVRAFARTFEIEAKPPTAFPGTPLLNNLNATFYAFANDHRRGEHDIDNLWRVFETQIALAHSDSKNTRADFTKAYNDTIRQFSLGWKLSMGLFWACPLRFVNLDSRNRWFIGDMALAGATLAQATPKEKDSPVHDGEAYLAICDTALAQLGSEECPYASLPELSDAAFRESERVNNERKAAAKTAEQQAQNNALGDADVRGIHYWLYAPGEAASMWDDFYQRGVMGLGWSELGDLHNYATKWDMRKRLVELNGGASSQKNSAHATWQFVHDIKPGDIIFAKRGMNEIIGRGVVLGDYEYTPEVTDGYPQLRSVCWTHRGSWSPDKKFAQKTLTDVTDYPDFVTEINSFFDDEEHVSVKETRDEALPSYNKEEFLEEVFMSEEGYDALVDVLMAKKNVILQGAPGVGKTFIAKRLAYSVMGMKDPERVQMVQFHQSYSYEDFIEGYRPSANGFELEKGAFYTFCKRAADNLDNDYFFIIDEINRGNLSKIFGELFMLIENDKRGSRNKLQLLYSHELFYVPANVHIIGMMNTADRSLAVLDYALRRRFAFFDLRPGFDSDGFAAYRESLGSTTFDKLIRCVKQLNAAIAADDSLGEGFCIGHSYFCGLSANGVTDSALIAIVEYELIPMLREYWFDEPSKVDEWADALRRAIK